MALRVTENKKQQLEKMAGTLAVSGYIRQALFGDKVTPRAKKHLKKKRKPKIDVVDVAKIWGILALSMAMEAHERTALEEYEKALIQEACSEIHEIKNMLIIALGIKPQGLVK